MSGSSVVPGLPNMTETPSPRRMSRNACLPEMYDMAGIINLRRAPVPPAPPSGRLRPADPLARLSRAFARAPVLAGRAPPADRLHADLVDASGRALSAGVPRDA